MFHFIHKFSEPTNGFQYCKICGKAKRVRCNHTYEEIGEFTCEYEDEVDDDIIIQKCIYCGILKSFDKRLGIYLGR